MNRYFGIFFEQGKNYRAIIGSEAFYKFGKFDIFFGFYPRHIGSRLTAARFDARKADVCRKIKEKYGVATLQAHFERSAVIAVDYPFFAVEYRT